MSDITIKIEMELQTSNIFFQVVAGDSSISNAEVEVFDSSGLSTGSKFTDSSGKVVFPDYPSAKTWKYTCIAKGYKPTSGTFNT